MTRKDLDLKPGTLPEIDAADSSVTFRMKIAGLRPNDQLTIRCDFDGEIYLSIHQPDE